LQARFAANATVPIELDDAIGALIHGFDRADPNARRIAAVVAAGHLEVAPRVWELTGFCVLDPGAIDPERNLVFALAGC
jgi:hypothetical protein